MTKAVDDITEKLEETGLKDPNSIDQPACDEHDEEDDEQEPLHVEIHPTENEDEPSLSSEGTPVFEDPPDEDDGEGEWITPDNVALHKSRALGLLPSEAKGKARDEEIWAGCMTADFAMQNVLLQMGLNLVGLEGKRIEKIKTWVLRCHACYK